MNCVYASKKFKDYALSYLVFIDNEKKYNRTAKILIEHLKHKKKAFDYMK